MPLRSLFRPLLVMSVIPFGLIGATLGHLLLGFTIGFMSMTGLIALGGILVNDSLILLEEITSRAERGEELLQAVMEGSKRRLRAVILTSVTTFLGMAPMMADRHPETRPLVPIAISLAFGLMFGTGITLILVPASFVLVTRVQQRIARIRAWIRGPEKKPSSPEVISEAAE